MENNRNTWIDYLRSFITVLVVAHHAALSYTTWASFDSIAYIRSTHAVVDRQRWAGFDVFVNFNDVFFMSLMFFIGGLFLVKSIQKKGRAAFLADRVYRLLIPFILLGTVLMLVAYFPAYYIAHKSTDLVDYVIDFFRIEQWPVGPPWFLWVLFAFNLLFALFYRPGKLTTRYHWMQSAGNKPVLVFFLLFVITWVLYVPISYNIGPSNWTGFYPFDFQLNRVLLYFGYFLLGVLIGRRNFNNELLSPNSRLVRYWPWWITLATAAFTGLTLVPGYLDQLSPTGAISSFSKAMIYYTLYAVSCTLSCLAFITVFRKNIHTEKSWWRSLSENAYLIYLFHFVFITWTQFLLLDINIPVILKFVASFATSLGLSWWCSIQLRQINLVRKYL